MLRMFVLFLLSAFFFAAGIAHFAATDGFAAIVPPALPFKREIVWVTGAMEIPISKVSGPSAYVIARSVR